MRIALTFLFVSASLFAGEVTDAVRALARQASAARVTTVLAESRRVTELSRAEIEAFAEAFDVSDPTPEILPDGRKIYAGPCKCLPTHGITFSFPEEEDLVLLVNLEAPPMVDVEEKDIDRLRIPWHTSLRLTPRSAESVIKFLSSK